MVPLYRIINIMGIYWSNPEIRNVGYKWVKNTICNFMCDVNFLYGLLVFDNFFKVV